MPLKYYALYTRLIISRSSSKTALLATVLVLAASCSSTPEQQQQQKQVENWNLLQQQYPREQFLTAIGEGATLKASQQQALFNLGKYFAVQVSGIQQSNNQLNISKVDGIEEVRTDVALNTNVRQQTDQLIQGAEIYPYGLIDDNYRSLAVLEKSQGRRILSNQISELDRQIQDALNQANNLGKKRIEAAGWLQTAVELAQIRSERHNQIQLLGGSNLPLEPSESQIRKLLNQHIRALPITLEFSNSISQQQRSLITNALAKAGINNTAGNNDYLLVINYHQQQPFKRNKWHWMNSQMRIQLSYKGTPKGEITWDLKTSATVEEQLQARMDTRLTKTLSAEIVNRMIRLAAELS